jgi:hypothetical protein
MVPRTASRPTHRAAHRLLLAVAALSAAKAVLLLVIATTPAWRAELAAAWGLPVGRALPLIIVSGVLYAASGAWAWRRLPGAFWFVAAVNTVAIAGAVRTLDTAWGLVSLVLSLLLLGLILSPGSRRALL